MSTERPSTHPAASRESRERPEPRGSPETANKVSRADRTTVSRCSAAIAFCRYPSPAAEWQPGGMRPGQTEPPIARARSPPSTEMPSSRQRDGGPKRACLCRESTLWKRATSHGLVKSVNKQTHFPSGRLPNPRSCIYAQFLIRPSRSRSSHRGDR